MEYAIQLLVPLLLGLWSGQALAQWLASRGLGHYDWITVVGCLLGFGMGLVMMYQRLMLDSTKPPSLKPPVAENSDEHAE